MKGNVREWAAHRTLAHHVGLLDAQAHEVIYFDLEVGHRRAKGCIRMECDEDTVFDIEAVDAFEYMLVYAQLQRVGRDVAVSARPFGDSN